MLTLVGHLWGQADSVRYRFRESPADATARRPLGPPWMLPNPSTYEVVYELTPDGKGYWVYERIGGRNIRPPLTLAGKSTNVCAAGSSSIAT